MPRLRLRRRWFWALAATMAFWGSAGAILARPAEPPGQTKPEGQSVSVPKAQRDGRAKKKAKPKPDAPPRTYMGRPIASVMSWQGAEWLFRETRIEEEQPEAMLRALKIPRGATVADVGAGAGYHSIRLARRVGPTGTVLATDVQPEMLDMLKANAREAGVTNIKRILATQSDTKLPAAKVDLAIMVDVYHECTYPETTLSALFASLKPGGRLVLVEFRGEDPDVPILPEHKMTLKQVRREVEPRGFVFKESLEFLPWQHVIIFQKPEQAKKDGEAGTDSNSRPRSGDKEP